MAGRTIRGKARFGVLSAVLAVSLGGMAEPGQAETANLRPLTPPEDAPRLTPGPDGRVLMQLNIEGQALGAPVTVTLRPFWDEDGRSYDFRLVGPGAAQDGKTAQTEIGQPIRLKAARIPEGRVVWGALEAELGAETNTLPLVLGAFGPSVEDAAALAVSQTGRARLVLDIGRHRAFGDKARFELTEFSSEGPPAEVGFPDPVKKGGLLTSIEVDLPETERHLTLDIDAFLPRTERAYSGALRTTIGGQSFIDTKLVLKREKWQTNATFKQIENSHGPAPLGLSLAAAGEEPVYGFWVASMTGAKEGFTPSKDLEVTLDGKPLEEFDRWDSEQIRRYALEPGVVRELVVNAKETLPPGSHEVTVRIGALNVASTNWPEAKLTLVGDRNWAAAVAVLIIAVVFSYVTTKGLSAMVQRRQLRRRLTEIQKKSWLRSDRWGALPVVRAFGRAKMADKALSLRLRLGNSRTWLSRFVTTPGLIEDEIKEVEDRMEVLQRLNALAIYWNAAPSASGAMVSDVDDAVVYRAQKILREIVDRLSQLQEGEAVGAGILGEIAALEAWEDRQKLEAGYWASLCGDIQLLLDGVDPDHFSFDDAPRRRLRDLLQSALATASDAAAKQDLAAALAAAEAAAGDGVATLRERLTPKLDGILDAAAVESELRALEACEREVVRRLRQELESVVTPGSLHDMILRERCYTKLKLIWEQRNDDERREWLVEQVRDDTPLDTILDAIDDEVWALLKIKGTVRIVPPDAQGRIEQYQPIDFKVECTDRRANTFLFKHGLEYEWHIDWGGDWPLKPVTRSTIVTQFIPQKEVEVQVGVTVRRGQESFSVGLAPKKKSSDEENPETKASGEGASAGDASGEMVFAKGAAKFKTVPTSAFDHLWPTPTPELIGIAIAMILAVVTGLQSAPFLTALEGSGMEYIALFAWGVGADQTKNLLANLESLTKGEGAAKT